MMREQDSRAARAPGVAVREPDAAREANRARETNGAREQNGARPLPAVNGEYPMVNATFHAAGAPRSVNVGLRYVF